MSLYSIKFNLIIFIVFIYITSPSIIKIPFKIKKEQNSSSQKIENIVENMSLFYKLYSLIEIGSPPQKIEVFYNLKLPNYFISNNCGDCVTFYSYKNSKSFSRIKTDEKHFLYGSTFYANETFYYFDENNNKKEIENMLIFLPELYKETKNNNIKNNNCLNIGLKFPDYENNKYQESFIQQLKHKNLINQYFWTMIFYDHSDELNKDYDGAFIFGDIFTDYYQKIYDNKEFSFNKVVHTYTGSKRIQKFPSQEIVLEWGIQFDEIYYKNSNSNEDNEDTKNNVYINDLISEFDINKNIIYGTSSYYHNIQRDFFNFYFNRNICIESYLRNKMYKYIYCHTSNFTKNDLEKFPSLNFKNKILRYIFTLDYKDLFLLTDDKKYYIFNIIIFNMLNLQKENNERWVLGMPFFRKYQFCFDIDNKIIYYYNKDRNFLDELTNRNKHEINNENREIENEEVTNNNQTAIGGSKRIKKNNDKKYVEIEKKKIIVVIILIIIFIVFAYILIIVIRKILLKKGYVIMRLKKANELIDDYDYSSKNINNSNDNKLINQECEMQVKKT